MSLLRISEKVFNLFLYKVTHVNVINYVKNMIAQNYQEVPQNKRHRYYAVTFLKTGSHDYHLVKLQTTLKKNPSNESK